MPDDAATLANAAATARPALRVKGLDHVVLRVASLDRAIDFYQKVLGCNIERTLEQPKLVQLRAGSAMIDLVAGDPGGGRNMDHFCLRIEPFDQAGIVAHLRSHDVAVGDIRTRYGAEGNGVSIYLTDPEGNQVELKGPSDGKPPPD